MRRNHFALIATVAAATLAAHAAGPVHSNRVATDKPAVVAAARPGNAPPVVGGPPQNKTAPAVSGTGLRRKRGDPGLNQ
jgi:hypothetical protein